MSESSKGTSRRIECRRQPCVAAPARPTIVTVRRVAQGVNEQASKSIVSVYYTGDNKPFAKLEDVALAPGKQSGRGANDSVGIDKRIFLVPGAQVLATLPDDNSVVLRRFDLDRELQRSGTDYLLVLSQPPSSVAVGETFQYQLDAKVKGGKLTYNLDSGPEGMTISKTGLVTWHVDRRPEDGSTSVIITVTGETGKNRAASLHVGCQWGPRSGTGGDGRQAARRTRLLRHGRLQPHSLRLPTASRPSSWRIRRSRGTCRGISTTCAWPAVAATLCSRCPRCRNSRCWTSVRAKSRATCRPVAAKCSSPAGGTACWSSIQKNG